MLFTNGKGGEIVAKKNRCYLCGGALRRGRCVECGLDNDRMTKRTYRLNETTPIHIKRKQIEAQRSEQIDYANEYKQKQNSMEKMGRDQDQRRNQRRSAEAEHRNTGQKQTTATKQEFKNVINQRMLERQRRVENTREQAKKSPKILKIIIIVYIAIVVVTTAGSCIADLFESITDSFYEFTDYGEYEVVQEEISPYVSDDEYLYVMRELPESGETFKDSLSQGNYLVGVHIPEGTYRIDLNSGNYGSIYVKDPDNFIYLSYSIGEGESCQYLENVRLYEGAYFEIYGNVDLQFLSENAKAWDPEYDSAELGDEIYLFDEGDTFIVDDVNMAGVYELEVTEGWATLTTTYQDENGNTISKSFWVDADDFQNTYKNIPILEGMEISVELGEVQLTPYVGTTAEDAKTLFEKINY